MRFSRARKAAIAVTTVLFASLLTVAAPAAATAAGTASIAGAVQTDAGSAPIASSYVTLYVKSGSGSSTYWAYKSAQFTNASGAYSFGNLDAGTYTLEFRAPSGQNFVDEWWNNKPTKDKATGIKLAKTTAKTGVVAKLAAGATVKGSITSSTTVETPFAYLLQPDNKTGYYRWKSAGKSVAADSAGNYTISGLRAGTYTVGFSALSPENIAPLFHGGTDNITKAKSFKVSAGGTVTGINGKLVKGVTVSGKVLTSTGKGIKGATIQVARKITVDGKAFWEYSLATTGTGGKYKVTGVAAGTIAVKALGPSNAGYSAAFYGGGKSFEGSKTFKLASGKSKTGVNVKLTKKLKSATPKISGTAKVGKKLTAKPGSWTKGTKLSYQWYSNGKVIKKATKSTYTISKSQKGKKITVKVTGSKSGYATVVKTSKATKKVG